MSILRQHTTPTIVIEAEPAPDIRDTEAFAVFREAVLAALLGAPKGLTYGEFRRMRDDLGDDLRDYDYWLRLVLEQLKGLGLARDEWAGHCTVWHAVRADLPTNPRRAFPL